MLKNDSIFSKMPFSFFNEVNTLLESYQVKTILDLGCGDGNLMTSFKTGKDYIIDGVDLYEPYLKDAKKTGTYRKLFKEDILKFKPKQKYDLVFSSHNIEHLKKQDGEKLLNKMATWSNKLVIVMTPYGFCTQHIEDGNLLQHHLSGWYPKDFEKHGFTTKVMGLSSYFVKDNGEMWTDTIASKALRIIVSPLFRLPDPYLVCHKVIATRKR